ncbi:MAG TPA: YlxR family protein [Aggregatilineales bacterium]|mgnify:CR=1 FL=1|jgi:predicted RNA-binding protein YlxR (DUF448 family)|nr:YlxR family protein [Aggregatilineales bacterium]
MSEVKQSSPRKHIPQRTCVVCRRHDAKRALIRIVRTAEGVFVDPTGKMGGRGAYLCDSAACWERAMKTDILSKALRTSLSGDDRLRLQQATPQP